MQWDTGSWPEAVRRPSNQERGVQSMISRAGDRLRPVRIVIGAGAGVTLGYFWLPAMEGVPKALTKEAAVAFLVALLMGSWWAIVLAPAAVAGGGILWQKTSCLLCASLSRPDWGDTALIWAAAMIGIVVGTIVGRHNCCQAGASRRVCGTARCFMRHNGSLDFIRPPARASRAP